MGGGVERPWRAGEVLGGGGGGRRYRREAAVGVVQWEPRPVGEGVEGGGGDRRRGVAGDGEGEDHYLTFGRVIGFGLWLTDKVACRDVNGRVKPDRWREECFVCRSVYI